MVGLKNNYVCIASAINVDVRGMGGRFRLLKPIAFLAVILIYARTINCIIYLNYSGTVVPDASGHKASRVGMISL